MDYQLMNSFKSIPSVTISVGMENNEKSNEKYELILKNLIKEVKKELENEYKDVDYSQLLSNLEETENEFQPFREYGSMIFFVSNELKKAVRVPFLVENEMRVGERFTTRKLLRKSNQNTHYYVLTLTNEESRLLEYQDNRLIQEIKDEHFPVTNRGFWTSDSLLNSMGSVRTSYKKEFFKWIDSELQSYLNRNPHPIVLAGVVENTSLYKTIANRNDLIIGEISGNFTKVKGESDLEVGLKANQIIEEYNSMKAIGIKEKLYEFNGKGRLEQDITTIYQAALEGRAKELIVDEEYYLEGTIQGDTIRMEPLDTEVEGYTEDIVNEIVYQVMRYGGEVVFLKKEQLGAYPNMVLITRY
ncbi:hypothetical protein [Carnobacterium maltaromaticum]|uniref:baeRF3 domain-containing protein n=1 Tax=Carnobacterium maltaromaticum TaxID=2751 RepID=UPI0012F725B6|nr:hypothetical protein [Carnobacterium maltaromaticum]